jgi:hypothetical protein
VSGAGCVVPDPELVSLAKSFIATHGVASAAKTLRISPQSLATLVAGLRIRSGTAVLVANGLNWSGPLRLPSSSADPLDDRADEILLSVSGNSGSQEHRWQPVESFALTRHQCSRCGWIRVRVGRVGFPNPIFVTTRSAFVFSHPDIVSASSGKSGLFCRSTARFCGKPDDWDARELDAALRLAASDREAARLCQRLRTKIKARVEARRLSKLEQLRRST